MLPYGVGDHVFFKEGEEGDSGSWGDNDWVVVHIAGSELMLKRGHLIICGIHADQVGRRATMTALRDRRPRGLKGPHAARHIAVVNAG